MATMNLKLRSGYSGRTEDPDRYFFSVPTRIAELLPADQEYECVLTEDGVLYRPITRVEEERMPAWLERAARNNEEGT